MKPALPEQALLQKADERTPLAAVFPVRKEPASGLFRELLDSLELHGVGLHTLRHSFASRAARAPFYVMEMLGHADIDMTAYYSHNGREDLVREAKKLEKRAGTDRVGTLNN